MKLSAVLRTGELGSNSHYQTPGIPNTGNTKLTTAPLSSSTSGPLVNFSFLIPISKSLFISSDFVIEVSFHTVSASLQNQ